MVNILAILGAERNIASWIDKWTVVVCMNKKILHNMNGHYSLMETATILMIAATGKRVLQQMSSSLILNILSAIP